MTETLRTRPRPDRTPVETTVNKSFLRGICVAMILVTPFWWAVIAIVVRLRSHG